MKHPQYIAILAAIICSPSAISAAEIDREAVDEFLFVLSQDPLNELAFEKVVFMYAKADRKGELTDRLKALVGGEPQAVVPRIILARLHLRSNQLDDAGSVLYPLVARETTDFRVLLLAADLKERQGDLQAAVGLLNRAQPLAKATDDGRTILTKKGHLLLRTGRPREAVEAWGAIAKLDGIDYELKLDMAALLASKGFDEDAATIYASLIDSPTVPAEKRLQLRAKLADVKARHGHAKDALKLYRDILSSIRSTHWMWGGTLDALLRGARRWGKADEAIAFLQRKAKENPDEPAWPLAMARCFVIRGRDANATSVLEEALQKWPRDSSVIAKLRSLYEKARQTSKLTTLYTGLAKQFPDDPEPQFGLATIALKGRQPEAGRGHIAQALALAKNGADALIRAARAYKAALYYEEALATYQKALAQSPGNLEIRKEACGMLFAMERGSEAPAFLLASYPDRDAVPPAEAIEIAQYLRGRGQSVDALQILRRASRRHQEHFAVQLAVSETAGALGDFSRAVVDAEQAIAAAETGAERMAVFGHLKNLCGKFDRQSLFLSKIHAYVAQHRGDVDAALFLAENLTEVGRAEDAQRRYAELAETHGDDVPFLRSQATYYEAIDDKDKALATYQLLAAKDLGNSGKHLIKVGALLTSMGLKDEARRTWDRVFELGSESAEVYVELAGKFKTPEEKAKVRACLENALRLDPECAPAVEKLGALYQQEGNLRAYVDLSQRRLSSEKLPDEDRKTIQSQLIDAVSARAWHTFGGEGAVTDRALWDLVEVIERTRGYADSKLTGAQLDVVLACAYLALGQKEQADAQVKEIREQLGKDAMCRLESGTCFDLNAHLDALLLRAGRTKAGPERRAPPPAIEPILPPFKRLWRHDVGDAQPAYVALSVFGDRLYVDSTLTGKVACLDKTSGQKLWEQRVWSDVSRFTGYHQTHQGYTAHTGIWPRLIATDAGATFVAADSVYGIDPQGKTTWESVSVHGGALASGQAGQRWSVTVSNPVLHRGRVIVYSPTGLRLLAFNAETGRLVWSTLFSTDSKDQGAKAPVVQAPQPKLFLRAGYVYLLNGFLSAFDADTGRFIWGTGQPAPPAASAKTAPFIVPRAPVYSSHRRGRRGPSPHQFFDITIDGSAAYLLAANYGIAKLALDLPFAAEWKTPQGRYFPPMLSLADRLVAFYGPRMVRLSKATGEAQDPVNLTMLSRRSPVPFQIAAQGGFVYIVADTILSQINPYDGTTSWQQRLQTSAAKPSGVGPRSVSARIRVGPVYHRGQVGGNGPLLIDGHTLYVVCSGPAVEAWEGRGAE